MFKSILGRLFWTYAIILMLVFTSVAVTVGIFVNHFAISTHMNKRYKRIAEFGVLDRITANRRYRLSCKSGI